jgi:hypothetical protein
MNFSLFTWLVLEVHGIENSNDFIISNIESFVRDGSFFWENWINDERSATRNLQRIIIKLLIFNSKTKSDWNTLQYIRKTSENIINHYVEYHLSIYFNFYSQLSTELFNQCKIWLLMILKMKFYWKSWSFLTTVI